MTSISDLADIEAIKVLKARYMRYIDTKNWDGFASLFTDDAVFDIAIDLEGKDRSCDTDGYVALTREIVGDATTVHQACMPEIEKTGRTTARGTWAMWDYLDYHGAPGPLSGGGSVVQGYGHYHEEYRKEDGEWRISSFSVSRLRLDEYPGPEAVLRG